jgi:hypothetical protein
MLAIRIKIFQKQFLAEMVIYKIDSRPRPTPEAPPWLSARATRTATRTLSSPTGTWCSSPTTRTPEVPTRWDSNPVPTLPSATTSLAYKWYLHETRFWLSHTKFGRTTKNRKTSIFCRPTQFCVGRHNFFASSDIILYTFRVSYKRAFNYNFQSLSSKPKIVFFSQFRFEINQTNSCMICV